MCYMNDISVSQDSPCVECVMETKREVSLIVLIFGGVEKYRILIRRSGNFTEFILAVWKFYGTEIEWNSKKADQW